MSAEQRTSKPKPEDYPMDRTIKFLLSVIAASLLMVGCMTAKYIEPVHRANDENYKLQVNENFDTVWKQLISYSATTFFAIENYEKDSGLLTLSFGAANPSDFITGGHWKLQDFDGDYVDYLSLYHNGSLTGKMNIVVTEISETKSQIVVNARYIYTTPAIQQVRRTTWSFDTGSCGTSMVGNSAAGTGTAKRTMCPTYKAEQAIISAIRG